MKKNKILMAAAELFPLVKVGGLGDVIGSLPDALTKLNLDINVIIPFYGVIDKNKFKIKLVKKRISIEIDNKKTYFDLYQTKVPKSKVKIFLIKHKLFNFKKIYLGGRKYLKSGKYTREIKDIERFTFFSKAVAEVIKKLNWNIDLLHCHDWHTALLPTFLDEYYIKYKDFKNIKTLFTIHNLANQGISGLDILDYAGLDHKMTPALMEDYYDLDGDKIDAMKIGILSADYINTVSPNYAQEILTKEYGEGLEIYLQRRKKHLRGIVNGIDYKFFNPQKDKFIKNKYTVKNYKKAKNNNKKYLQKEYNLPIQDVPLFGLVTRLVKQKGLDILLPALENILIKQKIQLVVLGTGQKKYEEAFIKLTNKYPNKVSSKITFNAEIAQRIYAGTDFFLMPSRFEPCGLGQMIAMRYGSIPIVRSTGGLKDTVKNNKTGLVFNKYKKQELEKILLKSIKLYNKRDKIIKNCMLTNFSWENSAQQYLKLYNKII